MGRVRDKLFDWAFRVLTTPRGAYSNKLPNNMVNLHRSIQKGDVVLVDGDQRISEVIKYLTQSSWSHSVIYVGDEILRRYPDRREELVAAHGPDAQHMIIEALSEGVVLAPLSKYTKFNLRVCRPHGLRREDIQRILDEIASQLGCRYDLKNLLDLARYFFPVSLIPRRFRRAALEFGSGMPTAVMCSSLIARAFQNVGFPILPTVLPTEEPEEPTPRLLDRLRRDRRPYPGLFHQVPTLITPRDFDLSPYFSIVKFNAIEASFDYRRIQWAPGIPRAASGGSRS